MLKPPRHLLAAALLAAVGVVGCTTGLPPDVADLNVVDVANRFALNVPPGWTVRQVGGSTAAILLGPEPACPVGRSPDGVRPNLNVVVEPTAVTATLEQVVQSNRRRLEEFRGFTLLDFSPRALADGRRAHLITFEHNAFGRPLRQQQLVVLARGKIYTLTATTSPEDFAANQPRFETVWRSFRAGW